MNAEPIDDMVHVPGHGYIKKPLNYNYAEALTPSAETKADYNGEFTFQKVSMDEYGFEHIQLLTVPWNTVKEIMRAIKNRAES